MIIDKSIKFSTNLVSIHCHRFIHPKLLSCDFWKARKVILETKFGKSFGVQNSIITFVTLEPAKPLNNAQIGGSFFFIKEKQKG